MKEKLLMHKKRTYIQLGEELRMLYPNQDLESIALIVKREIEEADIRIQKERARDPYEELKELAKTNHLILGWYRATNDASDEGDYSYYILNKDLEPTDDLIDRLSKNLWEQGYEEMVSSLDEEENAEEESDRIDSLAEVVLLDKMIEVMSSQFGYEKPIELLIKED